MDTQVGVPPFPGDCGHGEGETCLDCCPCVECCEDRAMLVRLRGAR
jgi:hypothetical protein